MFAIMIELYALVLALGQRTEDYRWSTLRIAYSNTGETLWRVTRHDGSHTDFQIKK